jgi:8-oxo-dGTP pyrophosphatase MutT (NUDIX family)
MKSIKEKQSVAIIIWNSVRTKVLLVKRPLNDSNFPGYWGFPAATKEKSDQNWEEVAIKAGRIKLGVKVKVVKYLGEDVSDRGKFILRLRDYVVKIVKGKPKVPQLFKGVTQYTKVKYTSNIRSLIKAAQKGALCSRIFLKSIGIDYQKPTRFKI